MEKRVWRRMGWAVAAAALLACGVLAVRQPQESGLTWENNATIGLMPGVDMQQRRKQLQQELDDSQIAFSLNSAPVFDSATSAGKLMLENPQNNHKLLTAELVLDATGETLYQSGALRPGSYLEEVTLTRPLPEGDYPVTVYLRAYSEDTKEPIGQTGAAVTLTVLRGLDIQK